MDFSPTLAEGLILVFVGVVPGSILWAMQRRSSRLDRLVECIHSLDKAVVELNTRVTFLEEGQSGIKSRLRSLEDRVGGLESRMDGLESRMDGLESRMDGLESRMDDGFKGLNERMDRLLELMLQDRAA